MIQYQYPYAKYIGVQRTTDRVFVICNRFEKPEAHKDPFFNVGLVERIREWENSCETIKVDKQQEDKIIELSKYNYLNNVYHLHPNWNNDIGDLYGIKVDANRIEIRDVLQPVYMSETGIVRPSEKFAFFKEPVIIEKKEEVTEAVEFAEWILKSNYTKCSDMNDNCFWGSRYQKAPYFSTQELYELFETTRT